jgi:signal transduction histidine kinase
LYLHICFIFNGYEEKAYATLLVASFALLIILSIFFFSLLKQIKKNRTLFSKIIESEMIGRENERKRISGDLHDDLCATLSGTFMQLQMVSGATCDDQNNLQRSGLNILNCIEIAKNIMNDLYPPTLEKYGLINSLEEYFNEIMCLYKIEILFQNEVHSIESKIIKEHTIHLFRIFKEITQNTIKHSKSAFLSVNLKESQKLIIIETNDQGVGFDFENYKSNRKSHGINNIINRVEIMQGVIYLNTIPGKGVNYIIEIPFDNAAK